MTLKSVKLAEGEAGCQVEQARTHWNPIRTNEDRSKPVSVTAFALSDTDGLQKLLMLFATELFCTGLHNWEKVQKEIRREAEEPRA